VTVSGQRLGKHVSAATNTHAIIELLLETGYFLCGPCRDVIITRTVGAMNSDPCGGGVEYLHRDPASRRRRRNGKSQNGDSKIWS
jgi:hypothetical protein